MLNKISQIEKYLITKEKDIVKVEMDSGATTLILEEGEYERISKWYVDQDDKEYIISVQDGIIKLKKGKINGISFQRPNNFSILIKNLISMLKTSVPNYSKIIKLIILSWIIGFIYSYCKSGSFILSDLTMKVMMSIPLSLSIIAMIIYFVIFIFRCLISFNNEYKVYFKEEKFNINSLLPNATIAIAFIVYSNSIVDFFKEIYYSLI